MSDSQLAVLLTTVYQSELLIYHVQPVTN